MMVLYRSPEQTDLHTYITVEVSAKFTALNFIALHHPSPPPPQTPPPPPPPHTHTNLPQQMFFFSF